MSELLAALGRPASEALEAVRVPLGLCDERGRTLFVNRALAHRLGVDLSGWRDQPLTHWLGSLVDARGRAALARGTEGRASTLSLPPPPGRKSGREEVLFLPGPIPGPAGRFLGFVFVLLPRRHAARAIVQHLDASVAAVRAVVHRVAGEHAPPSAPAHASLEELRRTVPALRRLSERELEVAAGISEGARTNDVARALAISPNTVRNHLKAIFRKLGVRDQAALIGKIRAWSEAGGER